MGERPFLGNAWGRDGRFLVQIWWVNGRFSHHPLKSLTQRREGAKKTLRVFAPSRQKTNGEGAMPIISRANILKS
jgi:hypothetical protein